MNSSKVKFAVVKIKYQYHQTYLVLGHKQRVQPVAYIGHGPVQHTFGTEFFLY